MQNSLANNFFPKKEKLQGKKYSEKAKMKIFKEKYNQNKPKRAYNNIKIGP